MNRTQRRAAAKHARRAKPARTLHQRTLQKVTDSLAGLQLLDDARPFDAGDTTDQHIKTRFAFGRLCDGTAGDDDFNRVAIAINLAKVRALDIDLQLADLLVSIHTRHYWRVKPDRRSHPRRLEWCFNPHPPLLAGETTGSGMTV